MTIYHNHHIIPRHMGGTDDPSNLVKLTIEEHAEAHKKLWEEHGRWQDKIAWQTLSGQKTNAEAILEAQRLGQLGRKHSDETKRKIGIKSVGRTSQSKWWIVVTPEGDRLEIRNLQEFCRTNGLDQSNMIAVSKGRLKKHKGYSCTKAFQSFVKS